jgi:hypothetical protein
VKRVPGEGGRGIQHGLTRGAVIKLGKAKKAANPLNATNDFANTVIAPPFTHFVLPFTLENVVWRLMRHNMWLLM